MRDNERDRRTADSRESEVSPEDIWAVPDEGGREPPEESSGLWEEGLPQPIESVESTNDPQALSAALSRLERLENSMTRLAEQIAEPPGTTPGAPGVGPRAVSEILRTVDDTVQTRLDEFMLEFRRGLSAVEKQLHELVTSSMWQEDEEGRPLAARVEDSLTTLRTGLAEVVETFRSAFGDQLSTQETVLGRVAEVEELIRDLGERRGLRRLAETEERLREQETAFVQQLSDAAERAAEEQERLQETLGQAFASLRVELMENTATRQEVQELTSQLGGFAEAVRQSLHAAVDQIRQGLEPAVEDLRARTEDTNSRLETFELTTVAAQREAITELKSGLEALISGLQDRVAGFEQAAREAPQQAMGEVRQEFMSELRTLQERVSAFEQSARETLGSLGEEFRSTIEGSISRFDAVTDEKSSAAQARVEAAAEALTESRELIDLRLRQFVEAFGSRMSEAETNLVGQVAQTLGEVVVATEAAQDRQQEVLREIGARLEQTSQALPGALASVREQLTAQSDTVQLAVGRMESLAGIIESLGRRRGFRDLIENEQELRREQAELVERLTAASDTLTARVDSLEGQLESFARTAEEQQEVGLAREQELRQMTVSLGEVVREALDRAERQLRTATSEEIDTRLIRFDEALERRLAVVARNDAQVERLSAGLLKLQVQVSEAFANSMTDLRRSLTEDVARQLIQEVDRRLDDARTIIGETVSAGSEANIQDLAKLRHEIREAIGGLGSELGDLRTRVEDGVRSVERETAAAVSQLGQTMEERFKALTESRGKRPPVKAKPTVRRRASRPPTEASS